MKKILVYHAYLYGDYTMMLAEQFSLLLSSHVFKNSDKLYIGISGTDEKGIDWIRRWWNFASSKEKEAANQKVEIVVYKENNELIPSLKWIRDYSAKNPDDYIMFFHTKGITKKNKATEDWRRYMEYFVIENWKDCIEKLDEGFDACGVMWNSDTVYGYYPHFSGQFFWARCDYINTLDHTFLDKDWRYAGEFWIGQTKRGARIYEFHNSRMNDKEKFAVCGSHYSVEYPRQKYAKEVKRESLSELNIENGLYLSDKGKIHNYLPDYDNLFAPYRDKHINIFECGYQYGGSARLWEKYFPNAMIRSIDINDPSDKPHEQDAINLGMQTNFEKGERTTFYKKDIKELTPEFFAQNPPDIAIDDGSHTLEDQLYFIKLIWFNLQKGGMMIIEDVADFDNRRIEFEKLGIYFVIIDKRKETGRFDEVLMIYKKP